MKRRNVWVWVATLVFSLAFVQFAPGLRAQSQNAPANQQPQMQQQNSKQVFQGQIVKTKSGQYALLVDKNAGKGFFLDNQQEAKKHDGQTVKVTGKLNPQTGVIQVASIQQSGQ